MFIIIAVIHVILCLCLMGLVLLQQGKGADAGAVLGGGGDSLMAVGGAGAAITKITTGLAVAFMITSLVLVKFYGQGITSNSAVVDSATLLKGSVVEADLANVEKELATNDSSAVVKPEAGSVKNDSVDTDGAENNKAKTAEAAANTTDSEQPKK